MEPNKNNGNDGNDGNDGNNGNNNRKHKYVESDEIIRAPIPVKMGKLLDDDEDEEQEFEIFRIGIMNDSTLDNYIKQALIESKRESIDKKKNSKLIKEKKIEKIRPFIDLLNSKFDELASETREILQKKIYNWVDSTESENSQIQLNSEIMYNIFDFIDSIEEKETNKERALSIEKLKYKIHTIFVPYDISDYIEYCKLMEGIKIKSKLDEEERLENVRRQEELKRQEELERQEEEERICREINLRTELFSQFKIILNRIALCDKNIETIKNQISISIDQFIQLEINQIELEPEIYTNLNKFICSIRIDKKIKEELSKIFVHIQN